MTSTYSPLRSLISVLLMVAAAVGLAMSAVAAPTPAWGDEEEEIAGLSMYDVSQDLSDVFSEVQRPDSSDSWSDDGWGTIASNPGSAGSMLGYTDSDANWLASALSGSSNTIGYESLWLQSAEGNDIVDSQQSFTHYASYGAALDGLGLDDTTTGLGMSFGNMILGGIMFILYTLTYAVDLLFNMVISVLTLTNPFRLFVDGVTEAQGETLGDGVAQGQEAPGVLQSLATWISEWYVTLVEIGWGVMVPVFLAVLVVGMLLFKSMNKGSAIKKFLIRILFLGVGLPLLGSMYTAALASVADDFSGGRTGGTQVIMSTYVDFEGWVENGRLAVPAGAVIEWDMDENSPTGDAQAGARNTALAINNQTHNLDLNVVTEADDLASWSEEAMASDDAGMTAGDFAVVADMLLRYIGDEQISASQWETGIKGFWSDQVDNGAAVISWFEHITGNSYDAEAELVDFTATEGLPVDEDYNGNFLRNNPLVSIQNEAGDTAGLQAETEDGVLTFSTDGNTRSIGECRYQGSMLSQPRECNLSPLAMFNYLNTDFGSTSMTLYSSGNVMSEATRSIHTSVNNVGTGTMSALYWVNSALLLGSFVLLGFAYALAMIFGAFKRGFQAIAAVPFATLGAIGGIAKVIIYTIALISEILITLFLYMFVVNFLMSLPQIVEAPFSALLRDDGLLASLGATAFVSFLTAGPGIVMLITVVSILAILGFLILSLRIRKTVIKAIDEAVTKLVEKLLDTQATPATGGAGGGGMGGALGSAAGASAANKLMAGGSASAGGSSAGSVPGALGPDAPDGGAPKAGPLQGGTGGDGTDGGQDDGRDGRPDGTDTGAGVSVAGQGDSRSDDKELGHSVSHSGLSLDGKGPDEHGEDGTETDVGDDAGSAAQDSVDESVESYKESDQAKLEAGKETAEAGVDAAQAAGKASSGDAVGAAQSAQDAAGHAQGAGEKLKESSEHEKEAGEMNVEKDSSQTDSESTSSEASEAEQSSTDVGPAGESTAEQSEQQSSVQGHTESGKTESSHDSESGDSTAEHSAVSDRSAETDASQRESSVEGHTESGSHDSQSDSVSASDAASGPEGRSSDSQVTVGGSDARSTNEANTAEGNQIANESAEISQRNQGGDSNLAQENVDGSTSSAEDRSSTSSVREGDTHQQVAPTAPKDASKSEHRPGQQPQKQGQQAPSQQPQKSGQSGGQQVPQAPQRRGDQQPGQRPGQQSPPAPKARDAQQSGRPPAPQQRPPQGARQQPANAPQPRQATGQPGNQGRPGQPGQRVQDRADRAPRQQAPAPTIRNQRTPAPRPNAAEQPSQKPVKREVKPQRGDKPADE